MKVLVIYDSLYGNTEKVARAIGVGAGGESEVSHIHKVDPARLSSVEVLFAGSPTQGGRPTKDMQYFLAKIPPGALNSVRVAAFDTRVKNWLAKVFGYSAPHLAKALKGKGGTLVVPPEGFFVKSTRGPEVEGELERATAWAKKVVEAAKLPK